MMDKLVERGAAIARDGQEQRVQRAAEQLRSLFGSSAVNVSETQVLVSGRGMIKRWLIDPSVRFLGGLK